MRLIDADALIEFIDAGHLRHPSELCFSELDVVNMLNHAPIAYDVDKVVEGIEEFYKEAERCGFSSALSDIVEFVKWGAV